MSDEKDLGEMEIPVLTDEPTENIEEASAAAAPQEGDAAQVAEEDEEGSRDIFDLGLDKRNSFRLLRKNVRHFIAHEEYGVLFSFCGVRITKKHVEYNPPKRETEMRCEKCKQHIWQIIATQKYAERLAKKKDLDD